MSFYTNHITINNPKIPVLSNSQMPMGKFVPTPIAPDDIFEDAVTTVTAQDMYLPNFSLRLYEGKILEDAVFSNLLGENTDLLGSCIFLKGSVKSILPGQKEGPHSTNWSQNFKFDPNNEYIHCCLGETDLHFIHLSYTQEYFNQFLPDEQWADILRTRISKKERLIGDHFSGITIAQEQALKNILNCPLEGKLGLMMMETSLIQVILIQLHSLFYKEEAFKQPIANRRDIEVIQQLKEYLTKSFLEDHCLPTLARQFGTNTNKLMSLFKKIFGKSIFEFIAEQRMGHATQLLQEYGLTVTEVARRVGYKNPNHFSAAFKRRYGINPSELK